MTWLDIVEFAKSKPAEFTLSVAPSGLRSCQFPLKGVQVEIGEDDWRLIVSGALDRFRLVPPQPLEEDETAEYATLDILEQRLNILIKRADEVARKARQLNYHLSGRRASINSRRAAAQSAPSQSFSPVNQARPPGANPTYDLHADLLQQFLAPAPPHASGHRLSSAGSVPPTPSALTTASSTPRASIQQQQVFVPGGQPSPRAHAEPPAIVSTPGVISSASASAARDLEEENRALVTARIEKMARGDVIHPPCDRCRRLKSQCVRHLTACMGCTRKHARCVWKALTEEEIAWLKGEGGPEGGGGGGSAGGGGGGGGEDDAGDESRRFGPGPLPHPHPEPPGEPRHDVDRGGGDDHGMGRAPSRIAVGRRADDVWRKGPEVSPSSSRPGSMDVDPRDIRHAVPDVEGSGGGGGGGGSGSGSGGGGSGGGGYKEQSRLSHMASVASAAADAATVAARGSPRHP